MREKKTCGVLRNLHGNDAIPSHHLLALVQPDTLIVEQSWEPVHFVMEEEEESVINVIKKGKKKRKR